MLVIGGGPAGATIAALLARKGHDVILLEKDRHPRFHVGESLLPANIALLHELGVLDAVAMIGRPTLGFEFVAPGYPAPIHVGFDPGRDGALTTGLQVRRADFDAILLRQAAREGAAVVEGCRAREVELLPARGGARVGARLDRGERLTFQSRFLVDASGRDTLLGHKFRTRIQSTRQQGPTLHAHFAGVRAAEAGPDGSTSIFWSEHGWAWSTPLADGTTSIGVVCEAPAPGARSRPLEQALDDSLARMPALRARLEGARRVSEVRLSGHDVFALQRSHGDNHLLVGDAFSAIGPAFFPGVLMAMRSGFEGAAAVDTLLRDPGRHDAALAQYDRVVRRGPRDFAWFADRMDRPALRDLLMRPHPGRPIRQAVQALLTGEVHGGSPIQTSLLAFKAAYHLGQLRHPRRTWEAIRRRPGGHALFHEGGGTGAPSAAGPGA